MKKSISIVIPVFNEEENLKLVQREISTVVAELSKRYEFEMIYVDDGSADGSWGVITQLATEDPQVRGLSLSRNFGHQCAIGAGLAHASGDAVITLDADLEHPPALIPALIERWEEGNLVVNAKRNSYVNRSKFKQLSSDTFYWLINHISDIRMEPGIADYRLLDRYVVDELAKIKEGERFFRGLIEWAGFDTATIEYDGGVRINGVSGYSIKKMFSLAWVAITSFSAFPMRMIVSFGVVITLASWLLLAVMLVARFGFESTYFSDMSFLVVFIISSNGFVLVAIGILALYILRIYKEVQQKPNYILGRKVNFKS